MSQHATTPAYCATQIRPIRAADLAALKSFLSELSPGTLYFRFGRMSMPMWSDEQWQTLCQPPSNQCAHFVATQIGEPGRYNIVGMARLVIDTANVDDCAEFSLVVADHLQRQGIGRQLMHALVGEASRRGLASIFGDVLPSNTSMLSFCEGLGFVARSSPDDARIRRLAISIKTQPSNRVNTSRSNKADVRTELHA